MNASLPVQVDPAAEQAELEAYLGEDFELSKLQRYDETLQAEFAEIGDEAALYRSSRAYLYNLTAFAMTLTKLPYLQDLAAAVAAPARLLDYGCGIGSDGLALIDANYEVAFADFANPSVDYLRWRLERRGRQAEIYDLDRDEIPPGYDAAYAFDVIEHVDDPVDFLGRMEAAARIVVVNLLEPVEGETELHRELPVQALVERAEAKRLLRHEVYHGRSHLLVYEA